MYVRFVVHEIDPDSKRKLGVFHAARNLIENGNLWTDQALPAGVHRLCRRDT
jgi:hypothetical protein